ncbi:MAG: hypothetical protein QM696_01390 [Steroidobacteraceae bacterium]
MIKKILLAYDGSADARSALRHHGGKAPDRKEAMTFARRCRNGQYVSPQTVA